MSKYIVEIEEKPLCVFDKDTQTYFPRLWRVKGFNSLVFDEEGLSRLEELNSDYINEHYGQLQDEAYQKGFEDGKKSIDLGCEGCKYFEDTSLTNPCSECTRAWKDHYTPAPHSDRIEVGDEVKHDTQGIGVVTRINEADGITYYNAVWSNGNTGYYRFDALKKTGKHYDIASILEAMK